MPWCWGKCMRSKQNCWACLLLSILTPDLASAKHTKTPNSCFVLLDIGVVQDSPWVSVFLGTHKCSSFSFPEETKLSAHFCTGIMNFLRGTKEPQEQAGRRRRSWGLGSVRDKPVLPFWPHKFPVYSSLHSQTTGWFQVHSNCDQNQTPRMNRHGLL